MDRNPEPSAPTAVDDDRYERVSRVGTLLDDAIPIPGTDYRVGLDPLVGLVPVVGDFTTAALSAYVVAEAVAAGVPRATLARMLFNLLVDAIVGSVPVLGDLFDAAWKANLRNVRLLEARAGSPEGARRDRRFLLVVVGVLTVLLVGVSVAAVWLLVRLVGWLGGLA